MERSAEHEREREKLWGNDKGMMFGLNVVFVGILASVLPVPSQVLTVNTELSYFACQSGCEGLSCSQSSTEHRDGN